MDILDFHRDLATARGLVNAYIPQNDQDLTKRLLVAMLDHSPTEQGQWNLSRDILDCTKHKAGEGRGLQELAEWYKVSFLIPIGSNAIQGLGPNEYLSGYPENMPHYQKNVLRRDNYRSVISGIVDWNSITNGWVEHPGARVTFTERAHIIPSFLGKHNEQALVWTALEKFSGLKLANDLCGQNIDRLENVFTLHPDEYSAFEQMIGWLEPVPNEQHTYQVCASVSSYHGFPEGNIVRFTTTDPTLPLPDPRFIAVHAACAKVLHTSGMERHIYRMTDEWENLLDLSEDNASAALSVALISAGATAW